jgi:hypothetical protein
MNKNSIFLFAHKPILNPKRIKVFEKLNAYYSIYLNSLLYLNWIEMFSSIKTNFDFYFVLNKEDKDFIPKNFIPDYGTVILLESGMSNFLKTIVKNIRQVNYTKQIYIFYNSIRVAKEDVTKTFNLLSIDDQSIVVGKSENELIAFLGTNTADNNILNNLFLENITYAKLLNNLSKMDIFIQTIDNFLTLNNFNDVKKLYIELSKKESLSFCSENMHERFNDLFIEYKNLLND